MKKLTFALAAITAYQVLPLLGQPHLLLHWKMLCIVAAAMMLWLSQPAIRQAQTTGSEDRQTMWLILLMAGVSTIVPEVEWAYFNGNVDGKLAWNCAGLAMMAGGTAFRLQAIRTLGRFFTARVQTTDEQQLVTTGVYAWLRHPSYLGAFIAILGIAVLLQAWVGFVVAAVAMFFAYARRISVEEAALARHFGEAWQAYRERSWRMVPGIW